MTTTALAQAIEAARPVDLDALSRAVWTDHAAGRLDDETAQALAERIQARRGKDDNVTFTGSPRTGAVALGRLRSIFPAKRLQRAPDRTVAIERRRRLAASGPMPPALASRFTTGQLAVLKIVADEFALNGACRLCVDALAARAGVSRRLAQGAVRLAEGDGFLVVIERPRRGDRHDTNVIRVISRAWLAWIARDGRSGGGCKSPHPTARNLQNRADEAPVETGQGAAGGQGRSFAAPHRESWPGTAKERRVMR